MMIENALEMHRALQLYVTTMDPETQLEAMLEVPRMFPAWQVGKKYKAKEVFSYGTNGVGDPQLYMAIGDVTADATYPPDVSISQYKAIGVTEDGYAEWVQPLGATDAYMEGDVVSYNGTLYVSTCNDNVWEPGVYGWEVYTA